MSKMLTAYRKRLDEKVQEVLAQTRTQHQRRLALMRCFTEAALEIWRGIPRTRRPDEPMVVALSVQAMRLMAWCQYYACESGDTVVFTRIEHQGLLRFLRGYRALFEQVEEQCSDLPPNPNGIDMERFAWVTLQKLGGTEELIMQAIGSVAHLRDGVVTVDAKVLGRLMEPLTALAFAWLQERDQRRMARMFARGSELLDAWLGFALAKDANDAQGT